MSDICELIKDIDRNSVTALLAESLPGLRASIGVSQKEIATLLGISRQSYSSIETGKKKMSWITYMALIMFFGYNDKTKNMIKRIGCFPVELQRVMNIDNRMEVRNEIYGRNED